MARFAQILSPAGDAVIKVTGLLATTSSAELAVGARRIFAINATQDITIRFGQTGVGAADATFYRIPSNQQTTFDMGSNSVVRVFNEGASAADVYILKLEGR